MNQLIFGSLGGNKFFQKVPFFLYIYSIKSQCMAGDLFFTSLVIFPTILVAGYIIQNLLWGKDRGPFTAIINILAFIGVFFHEISHAILSLFAGVPVKSISVRLRSEETGRIAPHGKIKTKGAYQNTLLQALLISLGPVLLGAWIFYFASEIALNPILDPFVRIIAGLVALSVIMTSTPSPQDFRVIMWTFGFDLRYSIYQLLLLISSIFLSWGIVVWFNIILPIEFLYYIAIIICYFVLKYSLITIRWGLNKIRSRFGNEKYRKGFRRFSRRTHKHLKLK